MHLKLTKIKKTTTKLLLSLFAIILITNSCKEKERTPAIYNIEQELKDWMFFDTSTWWLYKNLQTGELDSQYVTKSEIYYLESSNIKGKPYEKRQSAEIHLSNSYFYLITNNIEKLNQNWGSTNILFKPINKPITVGERISSCPPGYAEIKSIENNFTIDNIYYNTKITVFDNKDCSEGKDSVQYQVFKGVGIINKKNITKKQEWKLIKYHIKLNKN